MIRIEALRWALDRVLGRVLGGQITDDEKEVPQCRRLTTFACRQQTTVAVAKNVDHVDHAADELHEQPRELVTDHVGAH